MLAKNREFEGVIHNNVKWGSDYLVIGQYATAAWKHEAYGLKIMKAVDYREENTGISIISEAHWVAALENA